MAALTVHCVMGVVGLRLPRTHPGKLALCSQHSVTRFLYLDLEVVISCSGAGEWLILVS